MKIYQIELTNYCDSACSWCGHFSMKREKGFMNWDTFQQAVVYLKQAPPPDGEVGLHHFGEGLLHPHLDQYLDYLEHEGIDWRLSTNGRLLCKPELRQKLLKHKGLLMISLENGGAVEDVNHLIKEKKEQNSSLKLMLRTFGNTDLGKLSQGDYKLVNLRKPDVSQKGNGQFQNCRFLTEEWIVVLWNGNLVSCPMDMEGETKLGHVKTGLERKNLPWQRCLTCDTSFP